jgi:hypothetical protein
MPTCAIYKRCYGVAAHSTTQLRTCSPCATARPTEAYFSDKVCGEAKNFLTKEPEMLLKNLHPKT